MPRRTFVKVYSGPGYPIDPAKVIERFYLPECGTTDEAQQALMGQRDSVDHLYCYEKWVTVDFKTMEFKVKRRLPNGADPRLLDFVLRFKDDYKAYLGLDD